MGAGGRSVYSSVPSSRFFCEPKTTLKKLLKKRNGFLVDNDPV